MVWVKKVTPQEYSSDLSGNVRDVRLRYQTSNRANEFKMIYGCSCTLIDGQKCTWHYKKSLRRWQKRYYRWRLRQICGKDCGRGCGESVAKDVSEDMSIVATDTVDETVADVLSDVNYVVEDLGIKLWINFSFPLLTPTVVVELWVQFLLVINMKFALFSHLPADERRKFNTLNKHLKGRIR